MSTAEDLTTMDLSTLCMVTKDDHYDGTTVTKNEQDIQSNKMNTNSSEKRNFSEINDDNLPLDLSCSKSKRSCKENCWISEHTQDMHSSISNSDKLEQFRDLDYLTTTTISSNNSKKEKLISKDILDLTKLSSNFSMSMKQESSINDFTQIEQTIREKFQYSQPLPIPEGKYYFCCMSK